LRRHVSRSTTVLGAGLLSCCGIALLGLATHWTVACLGMVLFGMGWVTAYSSIQAAAQLVSPPWVRARALAIYQLSYNGALAAGSFGWGWLGAQIGLTNSLLTAAIGGILMTVAVRRYGLDPSSEKSAVSRFEPQPVPEAPAAELAPSLPLTRRRILETMHYRVDPSQRRAFLAAMSAVRQVRGRAGAVDWQLFEDVAHPEGWVETWMMDSWTDHLREAARLSDDDKSVLDRAGAFRSVGVPPPARYISVDPETHLHWTGQAALPKS
jgi:MFS family permease